MQPVEDIDLGYKFYCNVTIMTLELDFGLRILGIKGSTQNSCGW